MAAPVQPPLIHGIFRVVVRKRNPPLPYSGEVLRMLVGRIGDSQSVIETLVAQGAVVARR